MQRTSHSTEGSMQHWSKIMKMGYTFVTIGSPKFLAAIFRPNKYYFRPKYYSAENLHVKFNGAVKIRVQCFLNELFSRGKNISAEYFSAETFIF
jgi:hypothetical protein